MQPVQHSAICQVGRDGLELQCLAMNKLEVSAQDPREHRLAMAAAESTSNMPLSASALITHPTGAKRRDSAELIHEDDEQCRQQHDYGHVGGNQRGVNDFSDDGCKVMVNFNGFEPVPVGNPFAFPRFNDGDEDIVNVRSPIICNPSTSNARSASLSPTCVSALARDEVVKSDTDYDEPSWTIQEFKEYLGMLELLQNVSCDAEGGEMCLSANCLGQMERLLTSLLPQGV
ncbi:unnamed protein product [Peronospora farinosa]|uniref:Uncharacterized protein n=1 Tax=Peronospora farinosa TaxID=134698 RepID=A0AAV0UGU0_9STRA|nr:unnamed protein product [Peronospora farinosa]